MYPNKLVAYFFISMIDADMSTTLLQYGVKIFVITSFKDTCYIEILPHVSKSSRGNNI